MYSAFSTSPQDGTRPCSNLPRRASGSPQQGQRAFSKYELPEPLNTNIVIVSALPSSESESPPAPTQRRDATGYGSSSPYYLRRATRDVITTQRTINTRRAAAGPHTHHTARAKAPGISPHITTMPTQSGKSFLRYSPMILDIFLPERAPAPGSRRGPGCFWWTRRDEPACTKTVHGVQLLICRDRRCLKIEKPLA